MTKLKLDKEVGGGVLHEWRNQISSCCVFAFICVSDLFLAIHFETRFEMHFNIPVYFEKHFKTYTRMTCSATKMRCSRRKHSALTYCFCFLNWTAEKTLGKTARFGTSESTFWSWTTELRFDDFLNQESTNVSKNMHISDSLEKSTRQSNKYIAIIYKYYQIINISLYVWII